MKILVVLNYFYPYVSGVSEYARTLVKELSSSHEVTVLTGRHLESLPEQETIDGYRIVRANPLFFFNKGYISIDFVSKFRKLSEEADVVNLHLPMLESGLFAMICKKPLVLMYQCDMAIVGNFISKLAVHAVRWSSSLALQRAQQVVVTSLDYAKSSTFLAKHLHKTVEIAPLNRFANVPFEETVRGQETQERVLGFVGRIVHEKGIDVLLDAMELLAKHPIQLRIAGDFVGVAGGSVFASLSRKIEKLKNKVVILGKLDDSQLLAFYHQIDVLVLPSINRFEAFGMVQVEAMSFGAIVVASDLPGVRIPVRKTGMGFNARIGDAKDLADKILTSLELSKGVTREQVRSAVNSAFPYTDFKTAFEKVFSNANE